jgi:hypothetical protein
LDARQTIAVRTATAKARATQAVATFTPEPPTPTIYPVGYRAPWVDKMAKQADGTWMAPKEVVAEATKHYEEFYAWLRTKDREFVISSDSMQLDTYARFLAGYEIQRQRSFLVESDVDNLLVEPKKYVIRILRFRSFSQDGLVAICDVEIRGADWLLVSRGNGQTISTYSRPDRIDSDVLVYDPNTSRWKLVYTLSTLDVPWR